MLIILIPLNLRLIQRDYKTQEELFKKLNICS